MTLDRTAGAVSVATGSQTCHRTGRQGAGNYGGVWTIVALSVIVSIVLYAVATVVEAAVLAAWGPDAGASR